MAAVMSDKDDKSKTFEVDLEGAFPQANLFFRDQPAMDEVSDETWKYTQTAIDYGCAVFISSTKTRPGKEVRDLVTSALLRRATVTTEGIVQLLAFGLVEPATALTRTLLDIEVSLKIIHADPTDRMAKRLAAYHYITMQQHGQDMLGDRDTREGSLAGAGRVDEVRQIAGSYKKMLESGVLADVEKEVRGSRFWHGFDRVEDAFKSLGQSSDYLMPYDSATWFVHAVNVEYDMIDKTDSTITFRPFVERNPAPITMFIGHTLLRYITIVGTFLEDRGIPEDAAFQVKSTAVMPDGSKIEVPSFSVLALHLATHFNPPKSKG
jgi:hypothetical protein